MQVQINSDNSVNVPEDLMSHVAADIEGALNRYSDQITRVEVHLGDVNAAKGGSTDKRCLIEARLAGRKPIAVDHQAGTFEHAIDGATGKMQRAIETIIGKQKPH